MGFPFYHQLDSFDCGPTCLQMIAAYYGKRFSLDELREKSYITREGVSLLGICQAAEQISFRTMMVKTDLDTLKNECPLPAILHWDQHHFVVLHKIRKKFPLFSNKPKDEYLIVDPAHGPQKLSEAEFLKYWQANGEDRGVALLLEPVASFYEEEQETKQDNSWKALLGYLKPFRKQSVGLAGLMTLSLCITLALPLIAKNIIDLGILAKSTEVIFMLILLQFGLYVGGSVIDILRDRIHLNMNAKVSLHIISDFLKKMLRLPIRFFDSKSVGDLSQRIKDHHRIESFLTEDVVTTFFSVIQILVFSFILMHFGIFFWAAFMTFSLLGLTWVFLFQKKRKRLDYIRFLQNTKVEEKLYELIVGMQEVKLFGIETKKRWEWEFLQLRQYRLNTRTLRLQQFQFAGFRLINQISNVILTLLAAMAVVEGQITLGVMLSIAFILGQTQGLLMQLVRFFTSAQDAKLSLSRLNEVHKKLDEETDSLIKQMAPAEASMDQSLVLKDVSFQYHGPRSQNVLDKINLTIPKGKVTAIVGESGSGKTTLLKLLLGFYRPSSGEILVGQYPLHQISPSLWRRQCGTVMQDGYIFSDSIKSNIVMSDDEIDLEKFRAAVQISNLDDFVRELPLRYNTRIGVSGVGLSGGQKQRILIARAIYKSPSYLFLDEATSNLDANNESSIMTKLREESQGKTVVVVAHRLSTVKSADQIIVLEKGRIVEMGDHQLLAESKGIYYDLVRNQLELSN